MVSHTRVASSCKKDCFRGYGSESLCHPARAITRRGKAPLTKLPAGITVALSAATAHVYEIRLRKDHRGVNLISDALPFDRLWNCARIVFDCRMVNDAAIIKGDHK